MAQLAWAVLLIDTIALALGALAARHVGAGAFTVGVILAAFVTVVFAILVVGNLGVAWIVDQMLARRGRRNRSRPST